MSPTSGATWLKPTTRGLPGSVIAHSSLDLDKVGRPTPSRKPGRPQINSLAGARKRAGDRRPFHAKDPSRRSGGHAFSVSLGRLNHDLDLERRIGELGFD